MLHTHEVLIAKFLDEFIDGAHICCLNAATDTWVRVLTSEKFQDFFTNLVLISCRNHLKDEAAILTFSEKFAPIVLQLVISSLSIGTVAGVATVYQASQNLEKVLESIVESALKSNEAVAFMKRPPEGLV